MLIWTKPSYHLWWGIYCFGSELPHPFQVTGEGVWKMLSVHYHFRVREGLDGFWAVWDLKCICTVVELLRSTPRSHLLIRLKYLIRSTQSRITELRNKISTVKAAVKKGSVWGKLPHLCTKMWNDESFSLVYSWHTQCLLALFKKPNLHPVTPAVWQHS